MTAKLVKPLAVIEKDIQAIVFVTLPEGATVEFRPSGDLADVVWEGKEYSAMLQDVLDAAHPMEWAGPQGR
jgi:hypothetical protein